MFLQGLGSSWGLGATRIGSSSMLRVEQEGLASLSQVSTGRRPVESGVLNFDQLISAQERGLGAARKGIQEGISMLGVASEGLTTMIDKVHRLRELVISLGSGVRTTEDRDAIKGEIADIIGRFDAEAQSVRYNDRGLLYLPRRRPMTVKIQVGAEQGEQNAITFDQVDHRTTRLNIVATRNFDTVSGRRRALRELDFAQNKLVDLRQRYASQQLALEARLSVAEGGQISYAEAGSRLRDADMANAAVGFTRTQMLSQAGSALMAHNNLRVDGVRSLLGSLAG